MQVVLTLNYYQWGDYINHNFINSSLFTAVVKVAMGANGRYSVPQFCW